METFLEDLIQEQQRHGHQCAALVHAHEHMKGQGFASELSGVEIFRVPCWGRLLYAPISPSFPIWLKRTIECFKPDVLHVHLPNTSAFWMLQSDAAKKIPWVIHWHSDVVASKMDRRLGLAYPFYRPFEQALLKAARVIIATSPPYLEASSALAPWKKKCQIVPLGVNPARYPKPSEIDLIAAEAHWGNAQFRILNIGRLTYYKGHETLIAAMKELPGAGLIIVGEGEKRKRLEMQIREFGLGGSVNMAGYLPNQNISALLSTCDVFCLPSVERTEAFGMVILEAMHFAKGVVATRLAGSGVGWVVRDGVTGLLTQPGDVNDLANVLRQLMRNRDELMSLGAAGAKYFQNNFHARKIAEKIDEVYTLLT